MNAIIIKGAQLQSQSWKYFLKALCTDSSKSGIFNKLEITENEMVVTDGFRIHMMENIHQFQSGVYNIESKSAKSVVLEKTDGTYPEWKRLIDGDVEKKGTEFMSGENSNNSISLFTVFYELGIMLNYKFFDDMLIDETSFVPYLLTTDPIVFKHGNGNKTVIMPINPEY